MTPSDDLRAKVLAAAASTPSPTRAAWRLRTAVLSGLAALGALGFFFGKGGTRRGDRSDAALVGTAVLWAIVAASVTWLGLKPARSMLGRSRATLLGVLVGTAPALAATALLVALAEGPAVDPRMHLACGVLTVAQGVLPLVALAVLRRGGDPLYPVVTGASLGVAAGAWSALMAHLRCSYVGVPHVLLAHVLPVLVLAGVGAVVGATLLRVRVRGS